MNAHMSNDMADGCDGIAVVIVAIFAAAVIGIGAWAISNATQRPDACAGLTAAECSAATQEGR